MRVYRTWTQFGLLLTVLVGTVFLTSVSGQLPPLSKAEAKKLKNPVEATPQSIASGRQTYTRFCVSCHGRTGLGDGPGAAAVEGPVKPANLADEKWDHGSTDGEVYATIRDGVGPKFDMAAWGERVKETDIWNVINYIHSLAPKKP